MKPISFLLLLIISIKSYSQSDCTGLDARYQKEANAIEAKYFQYSSNPKTFTTAACNDHVPRNYCRLHHNQCANNCACLANYLREIQQIQAKYDVQRQLCAARLKKQQEIANAKSTAHGTGTIGNVAKNQAQGSGEATLLKSGDNTFTVSSESQSNGSDGSTSYITLHFTNNTARTLEVCLFMQVAHEHTSNGDYSGWLNIIQYWTSYDKNFYVLNGGVKWTANISEGTGKYLIYYRPAGSSLSFPTNEQVNQRFR